MKNIEVNIYDGGELESPRLSDCNIGKMICLHSKYHLGDWQEFKDLSSGQFGGWEDLQLHLMERYRTDIILPLYLMDHSGKSISTEPFGCRWDSGQIGFIIVDKQAMQNALGWKSITKNRRPVLVDILKGEVEIYNQWMNSEVYSYEILVEGEHVDSCGGFYDLDAMDEYVEHKYLSHLQKAKDEFRK